ncbi:MAG: YiiX/YebB-like N1pC/P60 family cysteine hydrolase [Promethearchaeota archaeon]
MTSLRKKVVIAISLVFFSSFFAFTLFVKPTTGFVSDGVNYVSPDNLLPGDIIVLGTPGSFFDYLIPGEYSHSELYCGVVQPGELIWDRDNHEWMAPGTPYVIHSTKSSNAGNGLGYSTFEEAVNNHAEDVLILRVLKPNGQLLSASERQAVVDWAKSRLEGGTDGYPVGPDYDINWFSKDVYGENYYCSELVWAAYMAVLGIDLDSETSTFDIGVSPDDLWHSQYTSVIAYESGSVTVNCPSDIVKVTVFVDEIYYDTDYDPWPKGAGEMYIISRSGLGDRDVDGNTLATEEGYPGNGKIGDVPDGTWSRNGAGPLDWNKYFYALVPVGRYMRIRIEAWEDDSVTDGDDQYPVWQWYWSYSTWQGYINNGWCWSGSRVDLGDCRYTIWFKIDTVY